MEDSDPKIFQNIIDKISPDTFRHKVLKSSMEFKKGWIDLANKLTDVLQNSLFKEWGYDTFDQYCRLEIRITKKTAMKLTGAWNFLKEEASDIIEGDRREKIPDFQAVELLQKAKKNDQWNDNAYDRFKANVFETSATGQELARQYREYNKLLGDPAEKPSGQSIAELSDKLGKKLASVNAPQYLKDYLSEIDRFAETLHRPELESVQ